MKKSEKNALLEWAAGLSDEKLKDEYYSSVYDWLDSQVGKMREQGYDICDIKERISYEKYLNEKSDILCSLCEKRGITLWENESKDISEVERNDNNISIPDM